VPFREIAHDRTGEVLALAERAVRLNRDAALRGVCGQVRLLEAGVKFDLIHRGHYLAFDQGAAEGSWRHRLRLPWTLVTDDSAPSEAVDSLAAEGVQVVVVSAESRRL
jgi:hypothetical protein